jgi:superfamily II DNA/RNA helicase
MSGCGVPHIFLSGRVRRKNKVTLRAPFEEHSLSFSEFNLPAPILKALEQEGYTEATPIQAEAVPLVMAGRDLIGSAQTGTGKTAAFMLPALALLSEFKQPRVRGPRVLVLAPTRELATQILDTARKLGKFMKLNTVSILGGMPYRLQLQLLSRPVDLMVATPGRLIDHIERGRVSLADLEMLILDEADRMLDMGFVDAVETIVAASPATRQTLLFTATFDKRMVQLTSKMLKDPARVAIEATTMTVDKIEQRVHFADDLGHKRRLLAHLAASPEVEKAIIFAATKRDADTLAEELNNQGHQASALHGDMTQSARNYTVQKLKQGRIRLLVATDVAARGIDVKDLTHVINFDLPRQAEDYVHRIGRTGRAGASGIAISFASPADRQLVDRIERYTGATLTQHVIPGLEPTANFNKRSSSPRKPGGFNKGPRRFGGPAGSGGGYAGRSEGGNGGGGGYAGRGGEGGGYRGRSVGGGAAQAPRPYAGNSNSQGQKPAGANHPGGDRPLKRAS